MFKRRNEAHVVFSKRDVQILVKLLNPIQVEVGAFKLGISCRQSDWQLSSLAQVSSASLPQALIPSVIYLYIQGGGASRLDWQDDIESSQWLELFHTFTAVNCLFISLEFLPRVAPALQELVDDRVMEVLPVLKALYIEGITKGMSTVPSEAVLELDPILPFISARQRIGRPITMSPWYRT
jgi:hypothetical protein